MRRPEREITDLNKIEQILNDAKVCRLALFDEEYPYIVPMCFGYDLDGDKLELYFHSAPKGKKIELIKANNRAAFEIDSLEQIIRGDIPCSFSAEYSSVTGVGTLDVINGIDKLTGLNLMMRKYDQTGKEFKYSEQMLNSVVVLKLTVEEFCCKSNQST